MPYDNGALTHTHMLNGGKFDESCPKLKALNDNGA